MSLSIEQWCQKNDLSRSAFYKLRKIGKAPRTMKVLDRVLISEDADRDWVREREAETMQEAA